MLKLANFDKLSVKFDKTKIIVLCSFIILNIFLIDYINALWYIT